MIRGTVEALDEVVITRLLEELGEGARAFRFDVAPDPSVKMQIQSNVLQEKRFLWELAHPDTKPTEAHSHRIATARPGA